jgi:pyruvate dehydrogenase E2 component (dihydrolipoamide acetyltransferase)
MSAPASTAPKGAVETVEPTAAQRTAARRVAEAKATIPDFQVVVDLEGGTGAPALEQVVAAAGRALLAHPRVNGAYVDAKYQQYERANVGVALGDGAIPTVRDADAKTPDAIASELSAARAAVDDGTLTAAAQAGSTFTLAALDVAAFTPIIQPGHAAALAVGTRSLTLSADARIVTPALGAAFLKALLAAL